MPASEWAGAPYVRIYSTLARDHRRVWRDDRLLAAYVRLLMAADATWPGPAALPRSIAEDVVAHLVAEEVIDVDEGLYLFHGLDDERKSRARRGQIGGFVRAGMADRDSLGRFAGAPLDDPSTNGVAHSVDNSVDTSTRDAGRPARPPTTPARPERAGVVVDTSRAPASARARADRPDPSRIACRDYIAHRAEHHWWGDGIGWKCSICEREDDATGKSFRERVLAASEAEDDDDRAPF